MLSINLESWKENSQIKPLNVKSSPLEGNQPAAIYLQTLDKFKYFQIKLMFYVLSVSYNQTIFNLNCILFQLKGQVTKITRIITCAVGYGASDNNSYKINTPEKLDSCTKIFTKYGGSQINSQTV